MTQVLSLKAALVSVIALVGAIAITPAQARPDPVIVVNVNTPSRVVQAKPVLVQHAHKPARVTYHHPQVYHSDHNSDRFARAGVQGAWGDRDRDGVPNKFDRDSRFYDAGAARRHVKWGDFDRDGVVNHFDRAPRNPYRQ